LSESRHHRLRGLIEDIKPLLSNSLERKRLGRHGAGGHLLQPDRVLACEPDCLGDCLRRHIRQQPAVPFIFNDFPTESGGNDGKPPSLRLELGEAKAVGECRKNKQVGIAVEPLGLSEFTFQPAFPQVVLEASSIEHL
jgi:hypothetical protein